MWFALAKGTLLANMMQNKCLKITCGLGHVLLHVESWHHQMSKPIIAKKWGKEGTDVSVSSLSSYQPTAEITLLSANTAVDRKAWASPERSAGLVQTSPKAQNHELKYMVIILSCSFWDLFVLQQKLTGILAVKIYCNTHYGIRPIF